MTAQIAAYGRLVADVQGKTVSNGNQMAYCRMAVKLPCRGAENGESTLWLAVTTFGRQAEYLLRHQKGDMISVSGNMQVTQWQDSHGAIQTGFQVVADSVISAKTVRPGGRKKDTNESPASRDEFSDDVPF